MKRNMQRGAFTLVELLVAISIITVLAAITLPTLKNSLREQRISRSAGLIQQYIEEARARAIGTGRPAGVVLERAGTEDAVNRSQVLRMRICTSAPQYVGDFGGAKATVSWNPSNPNIVTLSFDDKLCVMLNSAALNRTTAIRTGDYILIGEEQIPRSIATLTPADPSIPRLTEITVAFHEDGLPELSNSLIKREGLATPAQVPFAIVRQPTLSYAAPLELVDNTVIDLLYSGIGPVGTQFSPLSIESDATANSVFVNGVRDYMQIWIIFSPDGSVSRIFMGARQSSGAISGTQFTPLGDIHLLVGRTGQVLPDVPLAEENGDTPNLLDGQAVWVTINRMSGSTSSAPNDLTLITSVPGRATQAQVTAAVSGARSYARKSRD